jgi:hypothetical protein
LVCDGVQWGGEWAGDQCGDVEAGHCSQNENNSDFEGRHEKLLSPEEGPAMDIESQVPANATGLAAESERERPRAAAWLWKPWYAKAWWALCGFYWAGKMLSFWSDPLDRLYTTAGAAYFNVTLFPFTPLLVLGTGLVLAWIEYCSPLMSDAEPVSTRADIKLQDPYSDALDPRSGVLWIGHPRDIAKRYGRRWP